MKDSQKVGLTVAGLAVLALYLLNKKGLLHEAVTTTIGGVTVTPQNTILPDPVTGAPQFDSTIAATVPEQEAFAIAPIDSNGNITFTPSNPKGCTCPIGYILWHDAGSGRYECLPTS
jgi:hypothetical protein